MCYSFKNMLTGTALSLLLSVSVVYQVSAQNMNLNNNEVPGSVSLDLDAPDSNGKNLPILDDNPDNNLKPNENSNLITPSAPAAAQRALPEKEKVVNKTTGNDSLAPQPRVSNALLGSEQVAPLGDNNDNQLVQPKISANDLVIPNTSATIDSVVRPEDDPLADIGGESAALTQIDTNLFSKMSTLEKQSALLSLELRREKIKNEIEAIKAQRQQAQLEQQAAEEEKQRKKQEWENEQKKKLLEEEQKVKDLEAKMEGLRQEKIVKAYKEEMLQEKQQWIKNNEKIYQQMAEVEKEREFLLNDFQLKLSNLINLAKKTVIDAQNAKNRHNQDVDALKTKISVLQSRLDAELAEKNKSNPFAQLPAEKQVMLSDVYAIMEVVGKGENLAAKLINKNGDYFLVRKGTTLQTGHVIDEITETYIRGDIDGVKDYLYFTAGGILDSEPVSNAVITKAKMAATQGANGGVGGGAAGGANESLVGTAGIPSLGEGLFVR